MILIATIEGEPLKMRGGGWSVRLVGTCNVEMLDGALEEEPFDSTVYAWGAKPISGALVAIQYQRKPNGVLEVIQLQYIHPDVPALPMQEIPF